MHPSAPRDLRPDRPDRITALSIPGQLTQDSRSHMLVYQRTAFLRRLGSSASVIGEKVVFVYRFFDVTFALLGLVISLPIVVPVMLILKLTGEHYIFYLQPRVTRQGREFRVVKFATMLKESPNMPGGFLTQKSDPRILPFGRFLRKTKINELPQLVNILIGQMSFVGPRPTVRRHFELYSKEVRKVILSMPPGLTGIGSLVFRDEEGVLDRLGGDRKHYHDEVIAPYQNLFTYFALIVLTFWALFRPRTKIYRRIFRDLPPPPPELEGMV